MNAKWSAADIPDQSGRVVIVTGANSGLGYQTTLMLAAKGARVLMACRSLQRGNQAKEDILKALPHAQLEVIDLDLADLESLRPAAEMLRGSLDRLDLLINNAGVMAIPRQVTAQNFERQFGVNHLGHFALTGALLPLLLSTAGSRIVNVSSLAHRNGRIDFSDLHGTRKYSRFGAYSQSKLANLLFTVELHRRLQRTGAGAISVAAHPGWAATRLQYAAPNETGSTIEFYVMRTLNSLLAQSAAQGALPQLYAATAPGVSGGDYIGPDGWMEMRGHPRKVTAKATALDENTARDLWQVSVAHTGQMYTDL